MKTPIKELSTEQKQEIIGQYLKGVKGFRQLGRAMSPMFTKREAPEGTKCPKCGGKKVTISSMIFSGPWSGILECEKCDWREGVSTWIVKQAFVVERMPTGAMPVYDKEKSRE